MQLFPEGPQDVVLPDAGVHLGPVVAMVLATGGRAGSIRVDRLPVSTTSLWTRPARPDADDVPLSLHFRVKAALGFEHAVIDRYRIEVVRALRVGDRVGHHQRLRSVGPVTLTSRGPLRRWEVDLIVTDGSGDVVGVETFGAVGYVPGGRRRGPGSDSSQHPTRPAAPKVVERWTDRTISRAADACRVWAPVHHDRSAAVAAGLTGPIACTQHLAAMVEHAATVVGVPAELDLRMRRPVTAGTAPEVTIDPVGSSRLVVRVSQDGAVCARAAIRLAGT